MAGEYIDYDTYVTLGGALAQAAFDAAYPWAKSWLDAITHGRLTTTDWEAWEDEVALAMTALLDATPAVRSEQSGQAVTSFSNGQDSYSFATAAGGSSSPTYDGTEAYVVRLLPVELVSWCSSYNGAVC